MDIQPASAQPAKPISDDQELAKVLAGISKDPNNNYGYEETAGPVAPPFSPSPVAPPLPDPMAQPAAPAPTPVGDGLAPFSMPAAPVEDPEPSRGAPMQTPMFGDLEGIRKDALLELRPLVDKLDLAPEEKFDIYLLLLRSTDDTALIAPAHAAAKNIVDESKRAQALLDVIKEIDFLSVPSQQVEL